jgi:RimJ/RimL family protein N-acetyltransferase
MTFERTKDFELVRAIMTDPALYKHGADDFGLPREQFRPWENDGIWYVIVREDRSPFHECPGALLGMFILACNSAVQYEIHTRLLPRAWGPKATEAMRGVCAWAFATIPHCRRIVGSVPVTNRLACRFAERAGFQFFGLNRHSYMKGGRLVHQALFGMSPEALSS